MDLTTTLILILCFILAYVLIITSFSLAFQASGLPSDKARYQAISLFTNCGFTTSESELITSDRARRKLAMALMIIGHIFAVVIVSLVVTLIDDFSKQDLTKNAPIIGIYVGGVLVFFLIINLPFIKNPLVRVASNLVMKRALKKKKSNIIVVIDNYGKSSLTEIYLYTVPEILYDKSLKDIGLKRNYDINLIAVKRKNKMLNVTADTILQPLDKIIVYGELDYINKIFDMKDKEKKTIEISNDNKIQIIDNYEDDALCEIEINKIPEELDQKMLYESRIKELHNLNILMIKNGKRHSVASAKDIINEGDTILVFGPYSNIKNFFNIKE